MSASTAPSSLQLHRLLSGAGGSAAFATFVQEHENAYVPVNNHNNVPATQQHQLFQQQALSWMAVSQPESCNDDLHNNGIPVSNTTHCMCTTAQRVHMQQWELLTCVSVCVCVCGWSQLRIVFCRACWCVVARVVEWMCCSTRTVSCMCAALNTCSDCCSCITARQRYNNDVQH